MKHRIWIFLLISALAGCATQTGIKTDTTATPAPKPVEEKQWTARQEALQQIQSWQLNGKIAVQTARNAGSATVDWTQRARQYSIALMGPFGSNGLKLSGRPGNVTLITSEGKHITANNPEQLLAKTWGFHIPVSYMNYWVRGLPVGTLPANTKFDANNRITELSQQGWHIQYLAYAKTNGIDLPTRMSIYSSEMKVKIAIYHWQISSGSR